MDESTWVALKTRALNDRCSIGDVINSLVYMSRPDVKADLTQLFNANKTPSPKIPTAPDEYSQL